MPLIVGLLVQYRPNSESPLCLTELVLKTGFIMRHETDFFPKVQNS